MLYIKKLKTGKSQLLKDKAFCELLGSKLPAKNKLFTDLIHGMDKEIRSLDSTITGNALNNVHGDWYEWLIAIEAWNYYLENSRSNLALLLPNINQLDVSKLYVSSLSDLIEDLRRKLIEVSSVELITSNPDFVIIDRELSRTLMSSMEMITDINTDAISTFENAYKNFMGKCQFESIVGFMSVKTSFRPDRRLQIPHEGSLMKALYTHLQTRQWIINPTGLKYYAIAAAVGDADRKALKTVATHSITTVHNLPQAAVDEVFELNSRRQAEMIFESILNKAVS